VTGSTQDARGQRKRRRDRRENRLSGEACRKHLSPESDLTDEQLLKLRDQFYELAEVMITLLPTAEQRQEIDERAAIMEIDGGVPRKTVKRLAFLQHPREPR
jgi:hypothetical protein